MRETEREREAETQAEREAGSTQGARRGTRFQVSRITPWAEGDTTPLSHPGCPNTLIHFFFFKILFYLFIEREAETQAEGEAGTTQRARHGTRS